MSPAGLLLMTLPNPTALSVDQNQCLATGMFFFENTNFEEPTARVSLLVDPI
jgi:hypothetical protein